MHVLVTAGNNESLSNGVARVNEVFNKPDLARRLAIKNTVCDITDVDCRNLLTSLQWPILLYLQLVVFMTKISWEVDIMIVLS